MGKPPYGEAPTVASSIHNRLWDQYRTACNVPSGGVADFILHLVHLGSRNEAPLQPGLIGDVVLARRITLVLCPPGRFPLTQPSRPWLPCKLSLHSLPVQVFAIAFRSESPPVLVHRNEHGHCPQLDRGISSGRSTGVNRVRCPQQPPSDQAATTTRTRPGPTDSASCDRKGTGTTWWRPP